jgi:TRAP-type mannitol/chloroaromatic compound transport system permease large subunit
MPLGFDFDKDKMALVKYVAIVILAVPTIYAAVYGLEWLLNAIRGLTTPAGAPRREIDYEVSRSVIYAVLGAGAIGLVLLLILGKAVFKELARSFFPLTLLIMSVLGAIFFGIATPTEAAASARSARCCSPPPTARSISASSRNPYS